MAFPLISAKKKSTRSIPGGGGLVALRMRLAFLSLMPINPEVALRRQLATELYLITGDRDASLDAVGLQVDLASMMQGFRREDFDDRGVRISHEKEDESLHDYGRHARTQGMHFRLDVLAAERGIHRRGGMISVASGHDGAEIAHDRDVQAALFGGIENVRTVPIRLTRFESLARTQRL